MYSYKSKAAHEREGRIGESCATAKKRPRLTNVTRSTRGESLANNRCEIFRLPQETLPSTVSPTSEDDTHRRREVCEELVQYVPILYSTANFICRFT